MLISIWSNFSWNQEYFLTIIRESGNMVLLLSRKVLLLVVVLVFIFSVLLASLVKHDVVQFIRLKSGNLFKHFVLEIFLQGSSSSLDNTNLLFAIVCLTLVVKNVLRGNIVVVPLSLMWLMVLQEHIINPLYVLVMHFGQNTLWTRSYWIWCSYSEQSWR